MLLESMKFRKNLVLFHRVVILLLVSSLHTKASGMSMSIIELPTLTW